MGEKPRCVRSESGCVKDAGVQKWECEWDALPWREQLDSNLHTSSVFYEPHDVWSLKLCNYINGLQVENVVKGERSAMLLHFTVCSLL